MRTHDQVRRDCHNIQNIHHFGILVENKKGGSHGIAQFRMLLENETAGGGCCGHQVGTICHDDYLGRNSLRHYQDYSHLPPHTVHRQVGYQVGRCRVGRLFDFLVVVWDEDADLDNYEICNLLNIVGFNSYSVW